MGKKVGKRARAASFQLEGDTEDPLKRLQAFRERMFDLKPEESAPLVAASGGAGDAIPPVQWKAGKKSKARKKQRLVEDAAEEDTAVPTVKFAVSSSKKSCKKKGKSKDKSKDDTQAERSKMVQIPGQLTPRVGTAAAVQKAPTVDRDLTKKQKKKQQQQHVPNGEQLTKGKGATIGLASVTKPKASAVVPAFNDPAAKPFQEDADPLADVMKSVQEKMKAENAKRAKKTAFTASMSVSRAKAAGSDKKKKKKHKKRKAETEGGESHSTGEATASVTSACDEATAGSEADVKTVQEAAEVVAEMQPRTKKLKNAGAAQVPAPQPTKKDNTSEGDATAAASTAPAAGASTASTLNSPKATRKRKQSQAKKKQLPQQQGLKQENTHVTPTTLMAPTPKTNASANTIKEEGKPASGGVAAAPTEHRNAKPHVSENPIEQQTQQKKKAPPSNQQRQQKTTTPVPTTVKAAAKSVEKLAKPVNTSSSSISAQARRPIHTLKPKNAVVSDLSDDSDSDSDSGRPGRAKRTDAKHETSELSELSDFSEDEVADESSSSSGDDGDDNDARSGPQYQRQLFSALIDEAAREKWELPEVGRLVRLFSALGWARQTDATAKFLRHYCAELVSAEFLDGLDVTLSSKQLLGIFDHGSGKPEVFVNKVASAIENHYLRAKDPAVADALARKVSSLADPSTRGICEFLMPLLESLSTVRDVGAIFRRLCRHWQPERAASLVQHVLLTSVFDDLEGDQDEILRYMPQLKGLLDFPSRMAHADADEDGNLIGLIASEDEGDEKHSDGSEDDDEDDDDSEAALGEILSDEEDEDEEEEEYEGETDSEEEREAAIRYGPDQRQRRRSRFVLDEADESEDEDEDDGEDDEHGWEELVGSDVDE